ncbi:hypothetical protein GQ42DRAFT_57560 [Ramicandelaber brevisporus]|nr:hypothetical protein GQ42DRAFT_57560 [Ramicandelaber brevisporus]
MVESKNNSRRSEKADYHSNHSNHHRRLASYSRSADSSIVYTHSALSPTVQFEECHQSLLLLDGAPKKFFFELV